MVLGDVVLTKEFAPNEYSYDVPDISTLHEFSSSERHKSKLNDNLILAKHLDVSLVDCREDTTTSITAENGGKTTTTATTTTQCEVLNTNLASASSSIDVNEIHIYSTDQATC